MNRRTVLTLLLASALSACAPRPYTNPLSREVRKGLTIAEIDVVTTGTAFESVRAADYASRLSPELAGRLRQEFSDRLDPGGVTLSVEIARMNVAGATTTAFGRDQSRLQGTAQIRDREGNVLAVYPIHVVAGGAADTRTGALAQAAVTTADRFYRSLLDDFAKTTREQILGADLPGQRMLRRVSPN